MTEQKPSERFVVLRRSVMIDKRLTPSERNVYARICMFDRFFESAEATAEFVGVGRRTVVKAKQKLEKMGYIKTVQNTGRGKVYQPVYDEYTKQCSQSTPNSAVRVQQTVQSEYNKRCTIDKIENRMSKELNNMSAKADETAQKVLNYWCKQFAKDQKRYKLTKKRIAKIEARLKDAGAEMLKKAIDNASQDYFYRGENDRGWIADIDYITRSYEIVEKLANLQPARKAPKKPMSWQERQEQREFDEWKVKTDQQVERETNDDRYTLWTDPKTGKEEWILQSELRKKEGK